MEYHKVAIRIKNPVRKGFNIALKYMVQRLDESKKTFIAAVILKKPEDLRFYILSNSGELEKNKEFTTFKKEGRVSSIKIYEIGRKKE